MTREGLSFRVTSMNSNTKEALKDFITQVEQLTAGVIRDIGVQSASDIVTACENLKRALDSDETILETR